MQFGLLRRPSLQGVDVEQSANKINECDPIVHFYDSVSFELHLIWGVLTSIDLALLHIFSRHRI